MRFTWDQNKAARNVAKHRVSFEEAASAFDDPLYLDFFDPEHSEDECRYLRVGLSQLGRLLVIAYTERSESVRLISARKATRQERMLYEEH